MGGGIRIELTCAVDEYVHWTRESRHLPHPCDRLENNFSLLVLHKQTKDFTFLVSIKVVTMLTTEINAMQNA
jgi:hypothetical protein